MSAPYALRRNIFTIPPERPFARSLVRHLLTKTANDPSALADYKILLPTRRACRTVQDMFLQETGGRPLILPAIQPLGDLDEQDLSLSLAANSAAMEKILALPPAISPFKRRILLAHTIMKIEGFTAGMAQAIGLADALGQFLDQVIIEELEIEKLGEIVPEDFAAHWQITLSFLKILTQHWPEILAQYGVIDAATRRKELMHILAESWAETPPPGKIYAAGTTGSIPSTAKLLKTISQLEHGHIILPGLDRDLDEESWNAVAPSHPQFGLKQLLDYLEIPRGHVLDWDGEYHTGANEISPPARSVLMREIMRPAETSMSWTRLAEQPAQVTAIRKALENITLYEAENQREEALLIALKFRETLEAPDKTAVLVTPDRTLARRVAGYCRRWNLTVDDSAGEALNTTLCGQFLSLLCEAATAHLKPRALLALLKHDYCTLGMAREGYARALGHLERYALRGFAPQAGFSGLYERIAQLENSQMFARKNLLPEMKDFVERLERAIGDFVTALHSDNPQDYTPLLKAHLRAAEHLSASQDPAYTSRLWSDIAGEKAAGLMNELLAHGGDFGAVSAQTYLNIMQMMMSDIAVRPRFGTHPRIHILGQLEARLIDADLVILGSLNEGSWPPDPGHDPWMSRSMRKSFGLPDLDRAIGLAAHDFVQAMGAKTVMLTRAKMLDGSMTTPARWLQRLSAVISACGIDKAVLENSALPAWLKIFENHDTEITPYPRPQVLVPLAMRPKDYSVTSIETLIKDPYAIYARRILKLGKLDPLEKPVEAKDTGNILHGALEKFLKNHPDHLPADSVDKLLAYGAEIQADIANDPALWDYWWPQYKGMCEVFLEQEIDWRSNRRARPIAQEIRGEMMLDIAGAPIKLHGKIDRIDLMPDSDYALIDYKTGGTLSAAKIISGETPQLAIEAVMLEHNAFATAGITDKKSSVMAYWMIKGRGEDAKKVIELSDYVDKGKTDYRSVVEATQAGLHSLLSAYQDPDMRYICLPREANKPRFNDYEHLERIQEWAALGDETDFQDGE
jgi:ATP-dependent helicase/nuclease subunit B